ncbi:hypothetical protein KTR9_0432 [Gordonia sp. KTR9]|nr:hypothetical protein KTR9_0432 [Gordonia sp. KTR9]
MVCSHAIHPGVSQTDLGGRGRARLGPASAVADLTSTQPTGPARACAVASFVPKLPSSTGTRTVTTTSSPTMRHPTSSAPEDCRPARSRADAHGSTSPAT